MKNIGQFLLAFSVPPTIYFGYKYITDPYPPEVRKPLKYALVIKNKNTQTNEDIINAKSAFQEAIDEAKNRFPLDSMIYTGILVEAADFSLHYDPKYSVRKYGEALQHTLHLDDGSKLPRYLGKSTPDKKQIERASGIVLKLADAYKHVGDYKSAEILLTWSIESQIAASIDPKDMHKLREEAGIILRTINDQVGPCMESVAELYVHQKRYEEALNAYRGLLKILYDEEKDVTYTDNCRVAHVMNSTANSLEELNQRQEARKMLGKAQKIADKAKWMDIIPFDFEQKLFCRECREAIERNIETLRK